MFKSGFSKNNFKENRKPIFLFYNYNFENPLSLFSTIFLIDFSTYSNFLKWKKHLNMFSTFSRDMKLHFSKKLEMEK